MRAPIPEDLIMRHLDLLLTSSEPGAILHHLVVVAAPIVAAVGPLGLPDEAQLKTNIYAIAPDKTVDVERFIAKVIMASAVEAADASTVILFAGLSQEVWTAPMDEQTRRLINEHRQLSTHPEAAEVTVVYGASRDGRRWRGRRWLTGPKAGTTQNVDLLVGQSDPHEGNGVTCAPLVRRLVGIY